MLLSPIGPDGHRAMRFASILPGKPLLHSAAQAGVAKLVDAPDLGSGAARRGGSSPSTRTIIPFSRHFSQKPLLGLGLPEFNTQFSLSQEFKLSLARRTIFTGNTDFRSCQRREHEHL